MFMRLSGNLISETIETTRLRFLYAFVLNAMIGFCYSIVLIASGLARIFLGNLGTSGFTETMARVASPRV